MLAIRQMADSGFDDDIIVPSIYRTQASNLNDFWQSQYFLVNPILPIVTTFLFFVCSIAHLVVSLTTKKHYMLPLAFGCILELLGQTVKIACVLSTSASAVLNFYVLYSLITNLASCFFITSIGLMFLRVLKACPGKPVRSASTGVPHYIIFLEIVAFLIQSYGLSVQANPTLNGYWGLGQLCTIVGCGIESLNLLIVWISLAIILRRRKKAIESQERRFPPMLAAFSVVVAGSAFFVAIRSISRLVFHLSKRKKFEPFGNELQVFLLQSLPIAISAVFLLLFHPCRFDRGLSDATSSFFTPNSPNLMPVVTPKIRRPNDYPSLPEGHDSSSDDASTFCSIPLSPDSKSPSFPTPPLQLADFPPIQPSNQIKNESFAYHQRFSSAHQLGQNRFKSECGNSTTQTNERGGQRLRFETAEKENYECEMHERYESRIRRRQSNNHLGTFGQSTRNTLNALGIISHDQDNENVFRDVYPHSYSIYSEYHRDSKCFGPNEGDETSQQKESTSPNIDDSDQHSAYSDEEEPKLNA